MLDNINVSVQGHVKIWDPESGDIFLDKHNAINSEAMSLMIANNIGKFNSYYIFEMHFGNGGTVIDETGNITYKDVTTNLQNGLLAGLFNPTYFKVIDALDTNDNTDPNNNNIQIKHTEGLNYTDLIITCTLNKDEPKLNSAFNISNIAQDQYDAAPNFNGQYIFDELGLKTGAKGGTLNSGMLVSQIVFHPVQKSANRVIQIVYTLRIRVV
jgi:hypothetical protein